MNRAKLLSIALVLIVLNVSCFIIDVTDSTDESNDRVKGSGYLITDSRTLPNFNSVAMNTAGKVYITYSSEQELVVTVDQNIAEYIITSVHNGKLFIDTKRGVSLSNYKLIVN